MIELVKLHEREANSYIGVQQAVSYLYSYKNDYGLYRNDDAWSVINTQLHFGLLLVIFYYCNF